MGISIKQNNLNIFKTKLSKDLHKVPKSTFNTPKFDNVKMFKLKDLVSKE